jgi:nanoRNase/pAp phosphatase (c-di-AMP/oligoRNAs hydrolase)
MAEAREGAAPSRARIAVLLISDRPERLKELRRSALAGRQVFVWERTRRRVPSWSSALRGDPTLPATFESLRGREAIVVIDFADAARARRVAQAVREVFTVPSVLQIDRHRRETHPPVSPDVTRIDEGELLADAIEIVLRRLSDRRRVQGLRNALDGSRRCAFLVQNDPDPDAIASALALRSVLGFRPQDSPIITRGQITRPENRRLIQALHVSVRHVSRRTLAATAPLVLVDVQPPYFGDLLGDVAAVIDHHPVSGEFHARYRDVRTSYGASATMAAEYVLAENDSLLTRDLATALLYGIITDTRSLSRSASDDDLQMFATLFPRADHAALSRIQHPSYSSVALERFGRALLRARVTDGLAYVHLGSLPEDEEHIVAQLAEFCLGMAGAEVSAVSGVFGKNLVMSTRSLTPDARLGDHLREQFLSYGSAGGHPVMAKAVVDLAAWRADHPYHGPNGLEHAVRRELLRTLNSSRVSSPSSARARRSRRQSRTSSTA